MKKNDIFWIQALVNTASGVGYKNKTTQSLNLATAFFLEDLCSLMQDYSTYFNELIKKENPEFQFKVFRLGNPRPGLMLLRGRDKLVISSEQNVIRIRVVQVHAYNEISLEILSFEAGFSKYGNISWVDNSTNYVVNPELVAKEYIGPFLANGCKAYQDAFEKVSPKSTPLNELL